MWLYPRIIVSKSHGNTSMYVDTVTNFSQWPHTTYTYYIVHTTYILCTTYRMSDHIVSYWTQFRRDKNGPSYPSLLSLIHQEYSTTSFLVYFHRSQSISSSQSTYSTAASLHFWVTLKIMYRFWCSPRCSDGEKKCKKSTIKVECAYFDKCFFTLNWLTLTQKTHFVQFYLNIASYLLS